MKSEVLIPILSVALSAAMVFMGAAEWGGTFTTRRRVAAQIEQLSEVAQHSTKKDSNRDLQNTIDDLALRYTALTAIKLTRLDKQAVAMAAINTVAIFVIAFALSAWPGQPPVQGPFLLPHWVNPTDLIRDDTVAAVHANRWRDTAGDASGESRDVLVVGRPAD